MSETNQTETAAPRPNFAVCETCGEREAAPALPCKPTRDGQPVRRGYCDPCKDAARAHNEELAKKAAEEFVPTAEHWAAKKGMFPQLIRPPVPAGEKPTKIMGLVHNPKFALFAAAKHLHGWPQGKELSEDEFDAAIEAANDPSQNTFR